MNVYDFDNTIYDGESSLALFWFYIKKMPHLVKYYPKVLKAMYNYKKGNITIEDALQKYIPMIEPYVLKVIDTCDRNAKEFWDSHMHKIKPFYKEIQQDDDVIITASPEIFMREICNRLGVKEVIGTTFNHETGKIERFCYRKNKVKAFKERFGDAPIDKFYTDSINDAPLIEIAKEAYLVKGNKIQRIK